VGVDYTILVRQHCFTLVVVLKLLRGSFVLTSIISARRRRRRGIECIVHYRWRLSTRQIPGEWRRQRRDVRRPGRIARREVTGYRDDMGR